MIVPVGNKTYPSGLEDKKLAALGIGPGCAYQTYCWWKPWWDRPGVGYTRLQFLSSTVCVAFQVCISTCAACNRTTGFQWRLSSSPLPKGTKIFIHSGGVFHCKFQSISDNSFPSHGGVFSSIELWSMVRVRSTAVFLKFRSLLILGSLKNLSSFSFF